MKRLILFFVLISCFCFINSAVAQNTDNRVYGERICGDSGFICLTVNKGDSWESLWPDEREREIVMKLNRMNIPLEKGIILAVPADMKNKTFMDFSPFPAQTESLGEKFLIWDPKLLAWAAYDENGKLVRWGPGVGGKDYCPDVKRACRTIQGDFRIVFEAGVKYRSSIYPIDKCRGHAPGRPGCAPMPWYMQFEWHGYGFHGSPEVIGKNASHGCVRIFIPDAEWLNKNFVEVETRKTKGTKVIIRPY